MKNIMQLQRQMLAASGTYKYGNSFTHNILWRPNHTDTVRTRTPIRALSIIIIIYAKRNY